MRQITRLPILLALVLGASFALSPDASAQDRPWRREPEVRIPRPIVPAPGRITTETEVDARLDGSILQVYSSLTFVNRGGRTEEVEILLPVPPDAVVTDGLLLADGQEIRAEVMQAGKARAIYEEIVRSRRDPALIELAGHGLIRLSAFPIPPGGTRTVSFQTHQTLPAVEGRTRILLPLAALCGIGNEGPLRVHVEIDGSTAIAQVYSPSHDVRIDREGRDTAHLEWETDNQIPGEKLEVIVVRDARRIGFDLRTARGRQGEDDYFLLAVSPGWDLLVNRRSRPETKIFVLDTSGSMDGEKFEQAREALRVFLKELAPQDRFNLIAFSDRVRPLFDDGPQRANDRARREATRWLERLRPGGGTAIADAIVEATQRRWEADLVLFLTDGLPTVGETDADEILRLANRAPRGQRFYAFGVGYDVDARLLDQLAEQRSGSVTYVKPDEDVREAVATLVRRVEHPAARDVELTVSGARVSEVYPKGSQDLFAGEPLLFAGRVARNAGRATLRLTARGPNGERLVETWRVRFNDPDLRSSAVPVLWASRKASDLINRIHREGPDRETLAELRELSERYGILNEEFSLLAREDERLLADDRARRDIGRRNAAPAPDIQAWGGSGSLTYRGGQLSRSAPQASEAAPQSPGMTSLAPEAAGKVAQKSQGADAFEVSAESWRLREAGSAAEIQKQESKEATVQTVGGVTFRKQGESWVDERLASNGGKGLQVVKVRAYGKAYFELASRGGDIAEWLRLGERLRVRLDGMILEVAPDGRDDLDARTIEKIAAAAERG